ncbi:hypothetical protein PsorP6_014494 [Peronosclerospora sorghi]|uniref:Uncharacterized protein n=1 Tax=Peronosclerospora sorghi TaxID=230839 RepID=A0ACC0VUK1_9STRA|nr:hypothetical protein PsorP6_014494 [Peronosclerospora sorghi]
MEDIQVGFGPSVCTQRSTDVFSTEGIDLYLDLSCKGAIESITASDYAHFDVMVSFLVHRRKVKVALWNEIEQGQLGPLKILLNRCNQHCENCELQCMRSAYHACEMDHDCSTSHMCRGICEFCFKVYEGELPRCVYKTGHDGQCNCGKGDHTCGERFTLATASNCQLICELKTDHEGNHQCSVKQHVCGMPCSARNCSGRCFLSVEQKHTVHKCHNNECFHCCEMKGCNERCSTTHHFHDDPVDNGHLCFPDRGGDGGNVRHMCKSSHACNEMCEAKGVCSRYVLQSSSCFAGCYDDFDYDLKRMVGARNKCGIQLEPGERKHLGLHLCGKGADHGLYGHEGKHSTSHGNMKNMHFDNFEWNKRKYAPGEKGIAEMCGLYCSNGGRGHVHYLKCPHEQASECVYSGIADQRRHCTTLLSPKPKFELDEVLHGEYWKTIGWEDPCRSAMERAMFEQCPYLCDAEEHKGVGKRPSGCDLPAWHRPVTMQVYAVDGKYTYIDGHRFTCSHASSEIFRHILVLDCSGSMKGDPWKALEKAVLGYSRGRMECGFYDDIVSVVMFGDEGRIEYEGVKIRRAATRQFNFHGDGTFYAKGLREALALISRTDTKTYRPVVIFFTDGRPVDRKKGMHPLGCVGFGKVSDFGLEDLSSALGGKVHESCSMDMLTETSRSISMLLSCVVRTAMRK